MNSLTTKLRSLNIKDDFRITFYILSFMIVMFLFFHKDEVWASIVSIEEFAEHHLFLVFFSVAILLVFLYRRKVAKEIDIRRQRVINHYKLKKIRYKAHTAAEKKVFDQAPIFYIDKSKIKYLKFPKDEVIDNDSEIIKRKYDLQTAQLLGNKFKHKVRIHFKDNFSIKCTETTIWNVDDKHVSLKSGVTIPVNRIIKVLS